MSSQRSDWRERLRANPSRMEQEIAIKLQDNGIHYRTQVEIPVTTADFYFPLESRPLLVFVDGRVHLGTAQMVKDEELRSLLRKRGYRILELFYDSYFASPKPILGEVFAKLLTQRSAFLSHRETHYPRNQPSATWSSRLPFNTILLR